MPTQPCTQCFFPNAERLIGEESTSNFYTSKEGLDYKGNSAISLRKKTDINLRARLCSGHYAFHNSVSRARLPLPILNSRLLYQLVDRTSNFQIVAIALKSLVQDTFCL